MKIPGPDHPISISENPKRVVVRFNGQPLADTTHALMLQEAQYPVVNYIPRSDVDMSLLKRTDHATTCPFKGEAAYYSVAVGNESAENAVWSYESPHPAVAQIEDHLAFYPNVVAVTEEG